MKVLVLGAPGHIGNAFVREFLHQRQHVTAIIGSGFAAWTARQSDAATKNPTPGIIITSRVRTSLERYCNAAKTATSLATSRVMGIRLSLALRLSV